MTTRLYGYRLLKLYGHYITTVFFFIREEDSPYIYDVSCIGTSKVKFSLFHVLRLPSLESCLIST